MNTNTTRKSKRIRTKFSLRMNDYTTITLTIKEITKKGTFRENLSMSKNTLKVHITKTEINNISTKFTPTKSKKRDMKMKTRTKLKITRSSRSMSNKSRRRNQQSSNS